MQLPDLPTLQGLEGFNGHNFNGLRIPDPNNNTVWTIKDNLRSPLLGYYPAGWQLSNQRFMQDGEDFYLGRVLYQEPEKQPQNSNLKVWPAVKIAQIYELHHELNGDYLAQVLANMPFVEFSPQAGLTVKKLWTRPNSIQDTEYLIKPVRVTEKIVLAPEANYDGQGNFTIRQEFPLNDYEVVFLDCFLNLDFIQSDPYLSLQQAHTLLGRVLKSDFNDFGTILNKEELFFSADIGIIDRFRH